MKTPMGHIGADLPDAWLSASARGVHPLFESACIRAAFERLDQGLLSGPRLVVAQAALRRLSGLGEVDQIRYFLDALESDTLHLLIFLYFRHLDRFIRRRELTWH